MRTAVLTQPQRSVQPPDHGYILTNFTYYIHDVSEHMLYQWPLTTFYCTPSDGYGKYPKHVV
jgi:hypothetical protein